MQSGQETYVDVLRELGNRAFNQAKINSSQAATFLDDHYGYLTEPDLHERVQAITLINGVFTANTVLQSLIKEVFFGAHERGLRSMTSERESAVTILRGANGDFNNESYGAALNRVNRAMSEFIQTSKRLTVNEVNSDRELYAKMLFLKGILLCHLNKTFEAKQVLEYSLEFDPNNIMACNLLIFAENNNQGYIAKSLALDKNQIFANYYLAKNAKNIKEMKKQYKKLWDALSGKNAQELENIKATMQPFMIQLLLLDWWTYLVNEKSDVVDLKHFLEISFVAITQSMLSKTKGANGLFARQFSELYIQALLKLELARKFSKNFLPEDNLLFKKYSLPFKQKDKSTQHFSVVSIGKQDQTLHDTQLSLTLHDPFFSWLMEHSDDFHLRAFHDAGFLLDKKYANDMRDIILAWIELGWIVESNDMPDVVKGLFQELESNSEEIPVVSAKVVEWFIDVYIKGKGLSPWFKLVESPGKNSQNSLLFIFAKHYNAAIEIYSEQNGELNQLYKVDNKADDNNNNNNSKSEVVQPEVPLQLLFTKSDKPMKFLHALKAPSDLYCHSAIHACYDLLKIDNSNEFAKKTLQSMGRPVPSFTPSISPPVPLSNHAAESNVDQKKIVPQGYQYTYTEWLRGLSERLFTVENGVYVLSTIGLFSIALYMGNKEIAKNALTK